MIPADTTVKILEAARIEEVVGEFVSLKRRGSNMLGLCPFHQEKTPSFSVSPSKGIFKCFGCGKAGDSAKFIMEHDHCSYPDALRYLAKKYQIEIEEREQTPEELVALNERERLFNLNQFALQYFSETLFNSPDGKAIGLGYFRERDFREVIIRKFQLGYCPDKRDAFSKYALAAGYTEEVLLKTGLSTQHDQHLYDRFQARVIFPIHNLTGKVIGFGGRILSSDKSKAKYLNSPESEIYIKGKSLYGIYFAKSAISRLDNCLLVEGYTDVLTLHQAGIENVVASSGTSLTTEQIRLIRRFTNNITILYDGDKAGINASLRGIDMVLEEGMNVRIVLFPEGDDPDSFVRRHRSIEVEEYISKNSKDFISFKTNLLLEESANDPIKRAGLIKEIVQTIAIIPDSIYRSVYVKECSRLLEVSEQTLVNELNKILRTKLKKQIGADVPEPPVFHPAEQEAPSKEETALHPAYYQERELVKILLHHGREELNEKVTDENGTEHLYSESVARFIIGDLQEDKIVFEEPTHRKIFTIFTNSLNDGQVPGDQHFISHSEPDVALLAADLLSSPYELHNWERKKIFVKTELETLKLNITQCLYKYKERIIDQRLAQVSADLKETSDPDDQFILIQQKMQLDKLRYQINQALGIVISK